MSRQGRSGPAAFPREQRGGDELLPLRESRPPAGRDSHLRRDIVKLVCVAAAMAGMTALFFLTPALSTPTALSIVTTMLLSPLVAALERRGIHRGVSISLIFLALGAALASVGVWAAQSGLVEWDSFKVKAPQYFDATIERLRAYERDLKSSYTFLASVNPTDALVDWGRSTGQWFIENGPALAGDLVACLFIVPIITFVMLSDGRAIRRRFFQLIPNRYFEALFLVTNQIMTSLADYLRAKLVEAFLVGLMTTAGLMIVGAPYAIVLGIVAGVTNIVPYAGPLIGAIPGILIVALDPELAGLVWPVVIVYAVANAVDTVVIFPLVVAKLVDLHPLILIAVVAVGQRYYGLIGMLISVPVATAIKVIVGEVYAAVYEHRSISHVGTNTDDETPLLRVE